VVVVLAAIPAIAGDWPGWRGPARNGVSSETGLNWQWPAEGPKALWRASVGTGFSCIAIAGKRAFTLGNRDEVDTIYCLDAETGGELWKRSYPCKLDPKAYEGGPMATPAVEDGRVYTISKFGDCFCLNAETGDAIWSIQFQPPVRTEADYQAWWGFAGSPLIAGDRLILPVGTAGVAVDKLTGKTLWDNGPGYSGYSSPVQFEAGGQSCFAFVSGHEVVAGNIVDGRVRWKVLWKTTWDQNASDVIIMDNRLFVSSGHGVGCGLFDLSTNPPTPLWRNKNMKTYLSNCVLRQGSLFGFDDKELQCLDWQTGEVRWSSPRLGLGSLILAEGRLIVLQENGTLQIVEATAEAYKSLASAKVLTGRCWSAPALADGRLYLRSAAGDVLCLDLRK
jgi:outer membrane protein assembly factor BamB